MPFTFDGNNKQINEQASAIGLNQYPCDLHCTSVGNPQLCRHHYQRPCRRRRHNYL